MITVRCKHWYKERWGHFVKDENGRVYKLKVCDKCKVEAQNI